MWRHPLEILPVELRAPRVPHEPGDRVDERRLPGAVGPDQGDELAFLDDDVRVLDSVNAAEADGEVGGAEDAHGRAAAPAFRCALA